MRNKTKKDVKEFINSPRGHYIISQALCLAVDQLRSSPARERQDSNIQDMEYLIENAFPIYRSVEKMSEEVKKWKTK